VPGVAHFERWKGSFEPCSRQYFQTIGLRLTVAATGGAALVSRRGGNPPRLSPGGSGKGVLPWLKMGRQKQS